MRSVCAYWRECGVTDRYLVRTAFIEKDFGWTACGGGIFQCLPETELWLRSHDIAVERSSAVY